MRRRELVKVVTEIRNHLRRASADGFLSSRIATAQKMAEERLQSLHRLESLLPEIAEKLERP